MFEFSSLEAGQGWCGPGLRVIESGPRDRRHQRKCTTELRGFLKRGRHSRLPISNHLPVYLTFSLECGAFAALQRLVPSIKNSFQGIGFDNTVAMSSLRPASELL